MSLSIGIVGLPNVGKSTLFKVLTKKQVDIANYPFCTIEPNVGIVPVPDERLDKLAEFSKSERKIPATVKFVDIAGLVKGASRGEGLGNKFLANIREVDAILEVVRVFENPEIVHAENRINPEEDIKTIETELLLADIETVKNRMGSLEPKAKSGDKKSLEALGLLKELYSWLEQGNLAKDFNTEKEYRDYIKDMHLLTSKPILYLFNTSNDFDIPENLKKYNGIALDIKAEEDIAEMSDEEIKDLGIRSGIGDLIIKAYNILGLITFFTTGEKESRAWTIKEGARAPEAGGVIHSDFQNKFICALVINWRELLEAGSFGRAKEMGLLKTVGKDYIIKDGDVVEFKI